MKELLDRLSKSSWRTSLAGAIAVCGGFVLMFPQHFNSFWIDVAKFMTLGGAAAAWNSARDSATSREAHQEDRATIHEQAMQSEVIEDKVSAIEGKVEVVESQPINHIAATGDKTLQKVTKIESKLG